MEILGGIVVFFAALFAVLQRDSLSSGMVALSVSYALQVLPPHFKLPQKVIPHTIQTPCRHHVTSQLVFELSA